MQPDNRRFVYPMGEFFSGPGGLSLGAHQAAKEFASTLELKHAWAVDSDPSSCQTYMRNIDGADESNVFNTDARVVTKHFELSPIRGFAFGFPCNDFSVVGKRKGTKGSFGPLYREGIKILERFQPDWFVAENVGGLRSANDGTAFAQILEEMIDAGYRITPHLYKFEEYGVPQTRHRILIVGIRDDIDVTFKVPAPTITDPSAFKTAREALARIAPDSPNQELTRQSARVVERLKHIGPGENAFVDDMPRHLKLNINGATLSHIYRRLDPEKPSYTITGSGGGGTHVYHWEEPRALTNRERAKLQTFPDNFEFLGSKEEVRRQIGMAVPPKGARAVFRALFQTLLGINYKHVTPNIETPVLQTVISI